MRTKTFDSVKLMRELRDRLSRDMEQMTSEERIRYIRAKAASTPTGRSLGVDNENTAQQGDAADRPSAGR